MSLSSFEISVSICTINYYSYCTGFSTANVYKRHFNFDVGFILGSPKHLVFGPCSKISLTVSSLYMYSASYQQNMFQMFSGVNDSIFCVF